MSFRYTAFTLLFAICGIVSCASAQDRQQSPAAASGGPLMHEQATFDVTFYDLEMEIHPRTQTIEGQLEAYTGITLPTKWLVLALDTALTVSDVTVRDAGAWQQAAYERRNGQIWIHFPMTRQPGDSVRVRVRYHGTPRVAANPPWEGGFTWSETPSGAPWIAVSVQGEGADLWWPCKDHPSDEPDSMAISFTVPEPLVAASNGRLRRVEQHENGTRTYHWFVSTPINNYGVSVNIAPYERLDTTYTSITGETFPVRYWVLPAHVENGRWLIQEMLAYLQFFEKYFGPYPFRADKFGVAETPYLGMEHQTIIAYGADYQENAFGFDFLLHHEMSHEWWGNLVTAYDWKDFWLHEGFGTYTQAMYAGELNGMDAYHRYMASIRPYINNFKPVAPRTTRTTEQMYFAPPDYTRSDNDIYYKGSWILHTLRYLIGEEAFLASLRRMAYPEPRMEQWTNGRQCRFATTNDFLTVVERISGRELDWFFDLYLRQPELPRLISRRSEGTLSLQWETPADLPFPMPVEVQIGDSVRRVDMSGGSATISVPEDAAVQVDPNRWILKAL